LRNIAIDCNDLPIMITFWADLLEYRLLRQDQESALIAPSSSARPRIFLQRVPERPGEKNRLHIDLDVGAADLEGAVDRAVSLEARRVESFLEDGYGWWVLADPEGNVFCLARMRED
jgi:hypothetical protein